MVDFASPQKDVHLRRQIQMSSFKNSYNQTRYGHILNPIQTETRVGSVTIRISQPPQSALDAEHKQRRQVTDGIRHHIAFIRSDPA
jgi:hypothetical protein